MKKIELQGLNKTIYMGKLDNQLEYYFIPYEEKENYFISYGTRYGSETTAFYINNQLYKPPLGIAHYLEHKMFEEESQMDPFTFFASSGTDANAQTSFDYTKYICYGNKKFEENLEYLLQFVNHPYFTDENVEKEKGIIAEEIKMYEDNPTYQLEMKLRQNTYVSHPRKHDIAGSIEEINKITKEDLFKCYDNFYTPNNMFIIISGKFPMEKAEKIIQEELSKKEFKKVPRIQHIKESNEVEKKHDEITGEIEIPKIGISVKVPKKDLDMDDIELDLYLEMLTTILFGASSEFRERVRIAQILNDIYKEWESTKDYKTFYLYATTKDPDRLISEIEYELNHLSIPENSFERMKKVWIANEVKMIDDIELTENNIFDDLISYGKIVPNRIDIIRKMDCQKMDNLIKKINIEQQSIIKMIEKESAN